MTKFRRKGIALVETHKGILVVAGKSKEFTLPGGGANKNETRRKASMRELREETNLIAITAKYLFSYKGKIYHNFHGQEVRNNSKVFLVRAIGFARPRNEIKYLAWWKPGSDVNISRATKFLIDKYYFSKK